MRSPESLATVSVPGQHVVYNTPVKGGATEDGSHGAHAASSSSSVPGASAPRAGSQSVARLSYPYVMRHGRCYLNDGTLPYPLPCDIPELHRQTLRTLLMVHVFGGPFCAPWRRASPPRKVLEVACGSGFWSALCDQYFAERGYPNVSFTGLDFAPLAPDLTEQGMNWKFVQHDLRSLPLPFADGEFDLVMLKDMSLVVPTTGFQNRLMDEYLRVLAPGGILEMWESDHTVRTLLPHIPAAPGLSEADQRHASSLGIFPLHPGTPGAMPQNPHLQDLNAWLRKMLERRGLTATPCTAVGPMMLQEADTLGDQGNRRFAILLSEAKWEREGIGGTPLNGERGRGGDGTEGRGPAGGKQGRRVTAEQAALRHTALLTFIQMLESLELFIQRASGKGQDEWDRWWASMMEDLMAKDSLNGECLEVGAWWGWKHAS
ncbi:MAG: hypothetical protein M1838_001834 [Thelocarpon superellum]|nr:MAG: hypothetical protein M1838_001834 [Thelocarpon superellum]